MIYRRLTARCRFCADTAALVVAAFFYPPSSTVITSQGRNSFVRDNCHLLPGTVLPEGAVVPPFTVVRRLDPWHRTAVRRG